MVTALLAAIAMLATDIVGTAMVQLEAANRGWLAGCMDAVGWLVSIATTTISVTTLAGHDLAAKAWLIGLVSVANVVGTKLGTILGARLIKAKALRVRLAHAEPFNGEARP